MAGDLGWKSVELQIEALIPGVLILGEVHALTNQHHRCWAIPSASLPTGEFARAVFFVAAAYSLGLVSSYISRIVIDSVSERWPRKAVFARSAHQALDEVIADCSSNDPRFAADLKREQQKRKADAASWNAVYRSALRRTTRGDEVDRRRSQGRVIRNLLFPAFGAPLVFCPSPWSLLLAILSIPFIVFLYAYAEYVNFAEAYDISKAEPKRESAGKSAAIFPIF